MEINTNGKIHIAKRSTLLTVYFLLSLIVLMIINSFYKNDFEKWLRLFAILNITHSTVVFFILKGLNFRWISFSGFFLMLGYLFHFGQVYLDFFNYDFDRVANYIRYLESITIKDTLSYSFLVYIFTCFGIIFSLKSEKLMKKKDNAIINDSYKNINLKTLRTLGWIVIILFFPITIYVDFMKLDLSFSGNYLDSFQTEFGGIWADLSMLSYTGFILLIFGNSKRHIRSTLIISFLMVYLLLTMLGGSRGKQIIIVLLVIYIIHNKFIKVTWKNSLFLLVFMLLGLAFLNTIANFRLLFDRNIILFGQIYIESLQKNPIFEIISELGATIQTPYLVMQQIPFENPHGIGVTFYKSLFTIFPNVGGILRNVLLDINFMWKIRGTALGGSYVGELYYNFGFYGPIFSLFIGYVIQKISTKLDHYVVNNYYNFSLYVPIFINGLWWARNTFSSIVRLAVWNVLLLLVLRYFLKIVHKINQK